MGTTTADKAGLFDTMQPLLRSMFDEFKDLSKKKPDGAVNEGKIRIVNRLLSRCSEILKDEPSFEFLDFLCEDDMPQNSDVVLILSQWSTAMRHFLQIYSDGDLSVKYRSWYFE